MIQNRDLGDEDDYILQNNQSYRYNGLGMKYYKDFNLDKTVGYFFKRNDYGVYCCYIEVDENGNYSDTVKYKLIKPIGLY